MQELLQDKYKILHEVGRGGMAVVYKGTDTSLERDVAIKVLHPHLADRVESQIRFQREAKAVAKLHHPNILEIFDYSGLDSEKSYIVTEYIRGETLKDFTVRSAPSLPEIGAMVVYVIAEALAHAHQNGIIHRDIKPENIMIRDDGILKLMDFGIARMMEMQGMTVTGALVGSPAHMSPEHVEGKILDFRADVFSLGTLLYFLCTARLPFDSTSPHALLRQILEARYDDPRIHNPAIGRKLHGIIARCLQKEPDDRFTTVEELKLELASYLSDLKLKDPAAELCVYFETPATAEPELKQRIIDCLMIRAKSDAEHGRVAAALEAYNQVLSLQGDREDALAQVHRLTTARSRNTLLQRLLLSGAGLTIACVITYALWPATTPVEVITPVTVAPSASVDTAPTPTLNAPTQTPLAPLQPFQPLEENRSSRRIAESAPIAAAPKLKDQAVTVTASRGKNAKKTKRKKVRKTADNKIKPDKTLKKEPTKKPAAKTVQFKILAHPPAAQIIFEGRQYTGSTPLLNRATGNYKARISHPSCTFCKDRVHRIKLSDKTPPRILLPIGFKPAILVVNAMPTARITADGRASLPGRAIPFKMRKKQRVVRIKISATGYKTKRLTVKLTAGSSREIRVGLERVLKTEP